jgi:hypothetical protein
MVPRVVYVGLWLVHLGSEMLWSGVVNVVVRRRCSPRAVRCCLRNGLVWYGLPYSREGAHGVPLALSLCLCAIVSGSVALLLVLFGSNGSL